ncbi:alpha/beta hydrolase [Herbiconiux sp. P15]|uniref:alpha/beta hydrolase n=1 Tax=Herbiconiux liukaitaii TaxID=3342799 RepID=UPI0035BA4FE5
MGRRSIAQFVLGATAAALVLAGGATIAPAPAAQAATVAEQTCASELPERAVCGLLTVSENRSDPASRTIDLPYVVFPASSGTPTAAPLVTMAGGPGRSSTAVAETLAADERIGGTRDVVVLSQRGSLESSDPLDCPAASAAYVNTFTTDDLPSGEMGDVILALKDCVAAFGETGAINSYTKVAHADDLIDLRQALGYTVWSLYGDSWSTKVMQLAATRDGAAVDAVVLDAYSPIDRDVKGDAYLALSDTLTALSARSDGEYPDLNADLTAAATLFSDDPVGGLMTNPFSGRQRYYSLTGSDVITIVQQALYDPGTAAAVPYLLQRLAAGERDAINPFVARVLVQMADTSLGQYWIEQCRDEQPFWSVDPTVPATEEGAEPTALPVLTYFTAADEICASLGLPASPPEERAVSAVGQPTLILASDTDPLISVGAAQSGLAAFPNNQLVIVQSNGRAGATTDACALDQLGTWLAAPGSPVETTCTTSVEEYPIVAADDVHPTSRFDSVVRAIEDRNAFELTVPLIFAVFSGLWLLGWIIALLVQGLRREPIGLLIASGIAPVTGVAFLAAVWLTVTGALASSPGLTLIGVPTILPWLGILLAVGFLGLIPVWRLGNRPTAALAAAATLVWLGMGVWYVWIVVLTS